MKIKNFALKAILISSLAVASQSAFAATCVYVDQMYTAHSNTSFRAANQKILQDLVGMDAEINKYAKKEVEAIADAVFVLSNQKAVATTQINDALKINTQIQANAIQAINQTKRYQEVIKDYGKQGLGHDICNVSVKRDEIKEATVATQEAIEGMVRTEITARAGKYADKKKAMATRLALHNKYYCTDGQADAGLCSGAGERAGKSLSASTLFEPADYLSAEYNDKSAFINNMVGLPDDPVPLSQATTLAGQSYSDLKRRKDAIKSTAMASLKSIQASWSAMPNHESNHAPSKAAEAGVTTEKEQLDKNAPKTETASVAGAAKKGMVSSLASGFAPSGSKVTAPTTPSAESPSPEEARTLSLMAKVKEDVDRYLGGGEEYKAWSATLTGQEEKGLLTEILKVKALRLYMQSQQFSQLQRMEAMLAANVAAVTESSGMSARVEAQRQVALRQSIRDNIASR